MARVTLRSLLARDEPLVTPMAHDALSARLVQDAGFESVGLSGSALSAMHHALPDIGLIGLQETLDGARELLRGCNLPWGTDIDDGFGDAKSVVNAIRTLERMGCGQVVLEDQDGAAKKPGDTAAKALVPVEVMQAKVRAAVHTRDDAGGLILVARTDAAGLEGLDVAIRRAELYRAAGADAVFLAGLKTPEELRRAGEALRGGLQITAVGEHRIRSWPDPRELHAMGFDQISYPGQVITRLVAAMEGALDELLRFSRGALKPADMPNYEAAAASLQRHLRLQDWLASAHAFDAG